jgi:hypothetical protein
MTRLTTLYLHPSRITLSPHISVKDYEAKKCIGKVNNNLLKCLSCFTPPKACSYHRIRREVLELIMVLSPYYLLHHSPHSGAGIGLRRCGIWKVFIETNYGHRKMLVLWSEELEWAGEPPHSASSNCRQGDEAFGIIF